MHSLKKSFFSPEAVTLIVVSAYIAAQMLADVTSNKIGNLWGLAVDMGTFIYPFTFTLRDLVHKRLGKKNTRVIIITAGVINLLMALYIWFCAYFPSDVSFAYHEAFAAIFALTPRIVVASIIAEIASELLDTEIYHWFVTKVTTKYQWARVLLSNSISVAVDSLLFTILAFAFAENMAWESLIQIFIANVIIKYLVTLISIPLIYTVREKENN